jgi:hypothetical protein
VPDPKALKKQRSPHARDSILVAAVFRAFLSIYRARIADLLRIASNGTGHVDASLIIKHQSSPICTVTIRISS